MNSEPFTKVPNIIIDRRDLSSHEKLVILALLRFSFDKGTCWPSLRTIAERASLSKRTVQRTLDLLESRGAVKRESRREEGTNEPASSIYKLQKGIVTQTIPMDTQSIPYSHTDHTGIVPQTTEEDLIEEEDRRTSSPRFSEEARSILDYLNKRAGKSFRHSKTSLQPIEARLRDFSPEELRRVIDWKVKDWANDSKMVKYLRPETLFRESKFDGYLNEVPTKTKTATVDFMDCPHCGEPVLRGDSVCSHCKKSVEEASA
jgi:uncharacterized phage protein (TIGR02220 family)